MFKGPLPLVVRTFQFMLGATSIIIWWAAVAISKEDFSQGGPAAFAVNNAILSNSTFPILAFIIVVALNLLFFRVSVRTLRTFQNSPALALQFATAVCFLHLTLFTLAVLVIAQPPARVYQWQEALGLILASQCFIFPAAFVLSLGLAAMVTMLAGQVIGGKDQ